MTTTRKYNVRDEKDLTRSVHFRLEIALKATFFTVPLPFSMSKSFPFYFFFFPICTYQLLLLLMSFDEYSHYSRYISSLTVFPSSLSVSLAFFSVSLLSLSTLSFFTIYAFPHLNQSLCRNQVDVFK